MRGFLSFPLFKVKNFVEESFGIFRGKPHRVRIWFSPHVAEFIRSAHWHPGQRISTQKDGSIIFEATVSGLEDIKFWVMKWGANAVVLEPEFLRNDIIRELKEMLDNYNER